MTSDARPIDMPQAVRTLQATGRLGLQGAPSPGTRALRVLTLSLTVLVVIVAVGSIVFFVVAPVVGVKLGVASYLGFLSVLAMLVVLLLWLRSALRRQNRYAQAERLPVEIDARGLTLRGVGPVPWTDVAPAQYDWVHVSSGNAYQRRALMHLTESGLVAVNRHLPDELRARLGPASGLFANRHHRWISVPRARGISEKEMIELINRARAMFLGRREPQRGGGTS